MYTLTLTHEERKAIDWVGHRYSNGDDFYHLLILECDYDNDWDFDGDVEFRIPEHIAWEICKLEWPCFSKDFVEKLVSFCERMV